MCKPEFGLRTLRFGVQTVFGQRTLTFGVQIVSSICEHLCSICERCVRSANRVRRPNMSSQTELSVCTPNSAFALRTQRLHSERERSLTELTVCTPNLSVRRPNSVCKQTEFSVCRPNSAFADRNRCLDSEREGSQAELSVCRPNLAFVLRTWGFAHRSQNT